MGRLRASSVVGVVVWAAAGLCLAWALMRTFGIERGFPLQAVVAWTPFVVPVAAVMAIAAAVARRWGALACAALATVLLLVAIVPRVVGGGHDAEGADGPELRVLSTNVKLGLADPEAVVNLVAENEIDVLCVQELTPEMLAGLERAGLFDLLPHRVLAPGASSHGSAILAAYPLRELQGVEPPGYPFVMPRADIAVPGAASVEAVSVHPVPPTGPGAVTTWEEGLDSLPANAPGPVTLLIGDFNATLDHREFREVVDRGYVDAGDATGGGLAPTWPERLARPGVTIDHVLADERVAITGYEVHELPGSDHRAVSAVLRLPSG
jgi:endonuclease/exonuclease/phosphatase family metal-dependent hydrolase